MLPTTAARLSLSCGQTTTVTLNSREYLLRPPVEPCRSTPLPLLVLIHCYGCDAALELNKYKEAADTHGFVLAAPEGYHNSWNAPHCCGPARETAQDDVGFIDSVVRHAATLLPIASDATFAAGFSNGGFMSSHLAWSGTTRWAGISPSAGHEYAVNAERPLPVYIHHCAADDMVRIDGCCAADGGPTCCCGIGAQRKTCVSTATLFEQWLVANRCTGREAALAGPAGAQCTTGTGCVANATFCVHEGCFHQQWSRSFPAADAVVEFFARHACELRGAWRVAREGAPPRCARARVIVPLPAPSLADLPVACLAFTGVDAVVLLSERNAAMAIFA